MYSGTPIGSYLPGLISGEPIHKSVAEPALILAASPIGLLNNFQKDQLLLGRSLAAAVSSEDQVSCGMALTEDPENLRGKQKG